MRNTSVFQEYDMVVSYTQKMINDQLSQLTQMKTINPRLILVQEFDGNNFKYQILKGTDPIPKHGLSQVNENNRRILL